MGKRHATNKQTNEVPGFLLNPTDCRLNPTGPSPTLWLNDVYQKQIKSVPLKSRD